MMHQNIRDHNHARSMLFVGGGHTQRAEDSSLLTQGYIERFFLFQHDGGL